MQLKKIKQLIHIDFTPFQWTRLMSSKRLQNIANGKIPAARALSKMKDKFEMR